MCEIILLISKFFRTETTNSHRNLTKNSTAVFLLFTVHLKPILRKKNYRQLGHSLLCHQDIDVWTLLFFSVVPFVELPLYLICHHEYAAVAADWLPLRPFKVLWVNVFRPAYINCHFFQKSQKHIPQHDLFFTTIFIMDIVQEDNFFVWCIHPIVNSLRWSHEALINFC